jgi:hypothetical protein
MAPSTMWGSGAILGVFNMIAVGTGTGWEMDQYGEHQPYTWEQMIPLRMYEPVAETPDPVTATPEPGNVALMTSGLLALVYRRFR